MRMAAFRHIMKTWVEWPAYGRSTGRVLMQPRGCILPQRSIVRSDILVLTPPCLPGRTNSGRGGAEPSFACYNGAIVVNHCSLTGSQGYSLSLYSMHGTLLGTLQANNNQFLWYIDDLTHGASLSPGPYLLVLRAENYLITGKIFVK